MKGNKPAWASRKATGLGDGKAVDKVIDKFVVDYPLGYLRGGDALDFWYRMDAVRGSRLEVSMTVGILSKGVVDLYTPYETYYSSGHDAPTGIAERELRVRVSGSYRMMHGLAVHGGIGWQSFQGEGHVAGQDVSRGQGSLGVSWRFPE